MRTQKNGAVFHIVLLAVLKYEKTEILALCVQPAGHGGLSQSLCFWVQHSNEMMVSARASELPWWSESWKVAHQPSP